MYLLVAVVNALVYKSDAVNSSFCNSGLWNMGITIYLCSIMQKIMPCRRGNLYLDPRHVFLLLNLSQNHNSYLSYINFCSIITPKLFHTIFPMNFSPPKIVYHCNIAYVGMYCNCRCFIHVDVFQYKLGSFLFSVYKQKSSVVVQDGTLRYSYICYDPISSLFHGYLFFD